MPRKLAREALDRVARVEAQIDEAIGELTARLGKLEGAVSSLKGRATKLEKATDPVPASIDEPVDPVDPFEE